MATEPQIREENAESSPPKHAAGVSRRALFGAAAVGLAGRAAAQSSSSQLPPANDAPLSHRNDILELVNHVTQGFTEDEYALARSMGYDAYLEHQLDYLDIDDADLDQVLAGLPTLTMTGGELFANYQQQPFVPVIELRAANLLRSVYSKRQLYERMVEFWTDHFNMDHVENVLQFLKTVDDREVVRKHALGKFPDLLMASAKSGAMSWYLDNYASTVGNINENYSRELLELHTLGVDGPYTENDIVELARALTGWTFFPPQSPDFGEFLFIPSNHDNGTKFILGQFLPPNGGLGEGEFIIDFLAHHPATAKFVSRKMTSWLLGYDPPQSLVDRVANVYLATGGDIKDMIRTIMSPESLRAVNVWVARKHKRPYHFVVGLLRQAKPNVNQWFSVLERLGAMGQVPYTWPAPNGFPDSLGAWGSAVLPRWSFASDLFNNTLGGTFLSGQTILTLLGQVQPDQIAHRISAVLTGGMLTSEEIAEIQSFLNAQPLSLARVREAFALAASSPSYQFY